MQEETEKASLVPGLIHKGCVVHLPLDLIAFLAMAEGGGRP